MRLDRITLGQLRRAVELYFLESFRGVDKPVPRFEGDDDTPITAVLDRFTDDSKSNSCGARSYALRLGNARYPFMKLKLVEHLFKDEFFFLVDTHDQMFADKNDKDLEKLKVFNRDVKSKVEAAWEGAGLPTTLHLRGVNESCPIAAEPKKGKRILVVDDDEGIQETVATLLRLKGYDVDTANDGEEALETADPKRHALIVMDVEMPRMTGIEASEALRDDPERCRIPILLASAGAYPLAEKHAPGRCMMKPYHSEELFRRVDALLQSSATPDSSNGTASHG